MSVSTGNKIKFWHLCFGKKVTFYIEVVKEIFMGDTQGIYLSISVSVYLSIYLGLFCISNHTNGYVVIENFFFFVFAKNKMFIYTKPARPHSPCTLFLWCIVLLCKTCRKLFVTTASRNTAAKFDGCVGKWRILWVRLGGWGNNEGGWKCDGDAERVKYLLFFSIYWDRMSQCRWTVLSGERLYVHTGTQIEGWRKGW